MDKIKIYPPLYKRIDMIKYIYEHTHTHTHTIWGWIFGWMGCIILHTYRYIHNKLVVVVWLHYIYTIYMYL